MVHADLQMGKDYWNRLLTASILLFSFKCYRKLSLISLQANLFPSVNLRLLSLINQ